MIIALIFAAHLVFMLIVFTKKWQEESISSAFINLGLIIVLFAVGWSIVTAVAKIFIEPKGFGIYFDSDTISLTILTLIEFFFYKSYYGEDRPQTRK